jgi:hypothetical protein
LDYFFGLFVFPLARFFQEQDENLPSSQKINVFDTSHHLEKNYYVNFLGGLGSNEFQLK